MTPPLAASFFKSAVRHVARDVVDGAQAVVRRHHRIGADVDGLRDRVIGGVRDVDHHAEAIHFANHLPAAIVQPVPLGCRAAGVRIVAGPVVRGKLHRAHAQAVHLPDHGGVAIEVEAAFDIEHGGDLAALVDALDVGARCARSRWSGCCGRSVRGRNPACAAPVWSRGGPDSSPRSRRWKRRARPGRLPWRAAGRTGRRACVRRCRRRDRTRGRPRGRGRRRPAIARAGRARSAGVCAPAGAAAAVPKKPRARNKPLFYNRCEFEEVS